MSIEKTFKEIEKTGLMSREMALGKEMHEHLLALEGKALSDKPRRHERKVDQVCLYCGAKSNRLGWNLIHMCRYPMVIKEKRCPISDKPRMRRYFKIKLLDCFYRFEDYNSAILFRRLINHEKLPLQEVLKRTDLKWMFGDNNKIEKIIKERDSALKSKVEEME